MKLRVKRLLALFLAFMLIGTSAGFSALHVFAADDQKPEGPQLFKRTETSITLKVEDDMEYAVEIEDDETGEKIWKWAEDSQYDLTEGTVIFEKLESETEYKFAGTDKNVQDAKVETSLIKTLGPNSSEAEETGEETQSTEMTEQTDSMETIPESETIEETKESETIEETKESETIEETKESETVEETKESETIEETKESETIEETKESETIEETKESETVEETKESETIEETKESETVEETKESETVEETEQPEAPAAPELQERTDTRIKFKTVEGQEYARVMEGQAYAWQDSGIFENLEPGKVYSFVTRVKAKDEVPAGKVSIPLKISTKLSAAPAPAAPQMTECGTDYITLKSADDLEYGYSLDGSSWVWQDHSKFGGLKPGTKYYFAARVKFDPENAMESQISKPSEFKTYVAFAGTFEGVTEGAVFDKNTRLTVSVYGTGMDNKTPSIGDSRWIPRSWDWDGVNNQSWSAAPYSVSFTMDKVGTYKLTVNFELEVYTSEGWKATGQTEKNSISFKAINKVYKINASAGKHGKISPSGDVSVEEGSDMQFKITADPGYRLEKLIVDGVAVKNPGNKYTFANVRGNHTISASFISNIDAPKTGDQTPVLLIAGIAVVSVAAIVIILVVRRKQTKNDK